MQRHPRRAAVAGLVLGVLLPLAPAAGSGPPAGEPLSYTADGLDGVMADPRTDASGRFVAFWSYSDNITLDDRNGLMDVFLADRAAGTVRRLSVGHDGADSDGVSHLGGSMAGSPVGQVIDDAGGRVVFTSSATNLLPGDRLSIPRVYAYDIASGELEMVSVSTGGTPGYAEFPALSPDGRYVVLRGGPTLASTPGDLYLRDLEARTTRVLLRAGECPTCWGTAVTSGGRYVSFSTYRYDSCCGRLYTLEVLDTHTGEREVIAGPAPQSGSPYVTAMDASGRFVAFDFKTPLVPGEHAEWTTSADRTARVYVHDRSTGRTELVSLASDRPRDDCAGALGTVLGRSTCQTLLPPEPKPGWDLVKSISSDGRFVTVFGGGSSLSSRTGLVIDRELGTSEWAPVVSRDGRVLLHTDGRSLHAADHGRVALALDSATLEAQTARLTGHAHVRDGIGVLAADAADAPEAVALGGELSAADVRYRPQDNALRIRWRLSALPRLGAPSSDAAAAELALATAATTYELEGRVGAVRFVARAAAGAVVREADVPAAPDPVLDRRLPIGYRYELEVCDPDCRTLGEVPGQYGRATDEVELTVPLGLLGMRGTAGFSDLAVRTARRTLNGVTELDRMNLPAIPPSSHTLDVGLAPPGTSRTAVSLTPIPWSADGTFDVTLEAPAGSGSLHAFARHCFEGTCAWAEMPVEG